MNRYEPPEGRRRNRQGARRSRVCGCQDSDSLDSTTCVRRFDSNRRDSFRYGFWAHSLGTVKVDDSGVPLLDGGSYIPRNISGVADGGGSGGGDFMVSLGAFQSHVGNENAQVQASTFMHELGHTLRLRHGAVAGVNGIPTPEANCKPNYQSVMNYLYQISGLIVDSGPLAGKPTIDFSRQALSVPLVTPSGPKLNETSLSEAPGSGLKEGTSYSPYRARWFSPTLVSPGQSDPVDRHCDGSRLTQNEINAGVRMFSIEGTSAVGPLDWNANGKADTASSIRRTSTSIVVPIRSWIQPGTLGSGPSRASTTGPTSTCVKSPQDAMW